MGKKTPLVVAVVQGHFAVALGLRTAASGPLAAALVLLAEMNSLADGVVVVGSLELLRKEIAAFPHDAAFAAVWAGEEAP